MAEKSPCKKIYLWHGLFKKDNETTKISFKGGEIFDGF